MELQAPGNTSLSSCPLHPPHNPDLPFVLRHLSFVIPHLTLTPHALDPSPTPRPRPASTLAARRPPRQHLDLRRPPRRRKILPRLGTRQNQALRQPAKTSQRNHHSPPPCKLPTDPPLRNLRILPRHSNR